MDEILSPTELRRSLMRCRNDNNKTSSSPISSPTSSEPAEVNHNDIVVKPSRRIEEMIQKSDAKDILQISNNTHKSFLLKEAL